MITTTERPALECRPPRRCSPIWTLSCRVYSCRISVLMRPR